MVTNQLSGQRASVPPSRSRLRLGRAWLGTALHGNSLGSNAGSLATALNWGCSAFSEEVSEAEFALLSRDAGVHDSVSELQSCGCTSLIPSIADLLVGLASLKSLQRVRVQLRLGAEGMAPLVRQQVLYGRDGGGNRVRARAICGNVQPIVLQVEGACRF